MKLIQELPYLLIPSPLKPNNYVPEKLNCRLARMDFPPFVESNIPRPWGGHKIVGISKGG